MCEIGRHLRFESRARGGQSLHSGIEEPERVASGGFQFVHREIGAFQEFVDAQFALAIKGEADASGAMVRMAVQIVRLGEPVKDLLANDFSLPRRLGGVAGPEIRKQDDELVAAEPCDGVGRAYVACSRVAVSRRESRRCSVPWCR